MEYLNQQPVDLDDLDAETRNAVLDSRAKKKSWRFLRALRDDMNGFRRRWPYRKMQSSDDGAISNILQTRNSDIGVHAIRRIVNDSFRSEKIPAAAPDPDDAITETGPE